MQIRPLVAAAGLVVSCCATLSSSGAAGSESSESAPALTVGSMAPRISVDRWLKGAPVYSYERGRVYVVEFWATWCTPCVASIPHLTELQQKYPNITIIGVTASEQPTRSNLDDRLTKAEAFVAKQGTRMDYTVAYDGNGFMWSNWMIPAQRGGIPATFIVGPEGRIEWIGHPQMDEFDRALEEVVNRPGVRNDPSNWRTITVKPLNSTTTAPKKAAAPDRISTSQPTKIAPASTRLPAKPAPAAKKIASGPDRDDSTTPR
ncbi:MAG: TlpA family protein disulfide reductase [Phycisphaerae bacterium]|nr:TlpA family protein disulfide reductase [Phycisphaerae bacterium]MBN8599194.1 TlpA family protein disulfide reductase [Planctomycetota bacterium]